jgi:hypothetical protein
MIAIMDAFMVRATQALQCAEPKRCHVATMVFDMVDNVGHDGAALKGAELA